MRERRTGAVQPFRPPPPRPPSVLVIGLLWVALAFVLFKGFGWWERHQAERRPQAVQQERPTSQLAPPPPPAVQRPAPLVDTSGNLSRPDHPEAVTKCVNDGVVTYSNTGCEAGARRHVVEMPASQGPERVEPVAAPGTTPGTIYLCKAYDGGSFWAQAHCNQHRAHIDRIARVPDGLPFQQQVRLAEQQQRAAQEPAPAIVAMPRPDVAAAASKHRCAVLEAEIKAIDAMARQPLSPQYQDELAARRKNARGEQFRIPCR